MDQPDGCQEVPFNSFFGTSDVLNLRESCMRYVVPAFMWRQASKACGSGESNPPDAT